MNKLFVSTLLILFFTGCEDVLKDYLTDVKGEVLVNETAIAPIVQLKGEENITLNINQKYVEYNATAMDNLDGDISENITIIGEVDTKKLGIYTLTYLLMDSNGNESIPVTRTIQVVDTTPPVITLNGKSTIILGLNTPYTEEDAKAFDNTDENISKNIIITGNININKVGVYILTYNLKDSSGNIATSVKRTIQVVDTIAPSITLNGEQKITLNIAQSYVEENAEAIDNIDGNISSNIKITGSVDSSKVGIYQLTYTVEDSSGNRAIPLQRIVQVVDTVAPTITLNGESTIQIGFNESYIEQNAQAIDNVDGDISGNIQITGSVDSMHIGTYNLTYNVEDSSNNSAVSIDRTVEVVDKTAPLIQLNGEALIKIKRNQTYFEQNAIAIDDVDGDVSTFIEISGEVNNNRVGIYTLTYNVEDNHGNIAESIVRTIHILDITPPIITLNGESNISLNINQIYLEQNANATDNIEGNISEKIVINGLVDTTSVGTYNITYRIQDREGNKADVTRTINILPILKKTLQATSYDSNLKDDGFYQKGVDLNFTRDDLNETVTDNLTGLIWQDDDAVDTLKKVWLTSENSTLCGNDINSTACLDITGDTASTYCSELVLAEYDDWRLPTVKELESLVIYSDNDKSITEIFQNVALKKYWSTVNLMSDSSKAWTVDFNIGNTQEEIKSYNTYVRCVRTKN